MEDTELIMIGKGGRPLRSCDFPAGILFYGWEGGKEDELLASFERDDPPPTSFTRSAPRIFYEIQIRVKPNLIEINARLKHESKKEGYVPSGLGRGFAGEVYEITGGLCFPLFGMRFFQGACR